MEIQTGFIATHMHGVYCLYMFRLLRGGSPLQLHASEGQETVRWLQVLGNLSRDISLTTSNIDQSLVAFLQKVTERARVDAVAVLTMDADMQVLSYYASAGLSDRFLRYFNHTDRIRLGTGAIGMAVQQGTVSIISDVWGNKELGPTRWNVMYKEEGVRSLLVVPMIVGTKPMGAVVAFTKEPHRYDANEQFFFEVLASQIAISIENSKSFRSVEKSSSDLRSQVSKLIHLQDSFQAINTYLNKSVDQAIEFLSSYIQRSFQGKGIAIFEVTQEKDKLTFLGAHGMSARYVAFMKQSPISATSEGSLVARAFREKKEQMSGRVFTDDRLEKKWVRVLSDEDVSAVAVFPLQAESQVFGALVVYYEHLHTFNDEEISVLGAFSQFLGILLENRNIFASLVTEKQKTQSIVSSLRDGLLVYDPEGVIIDLNPRASELLGIVRTDVVGMVPAQGKARVSKGVAVVREISRMEMPEYETTPMDITYPHDTRLEITQVPLYDEEHKKIGSMRILHDVTLEYRAELLKVNFLTTAAHQLRTPLTGLSWGIQSLLTPATGPITPEQKKVIDRLGELTKFMITLVNDLLSNSKIEDGKMTYSFVKQSIMPIIHQTVSQLTQQVEKKHVKIIVTPEKDEEVPQAMFDQNTISLALHNVIDNAVNYSPDNAEVHINVTSEEDSLILTVIDIGIGIPKEDQKLLFNKFFRGSNAVKVRTDGSGLGLFLTKTVIDHHGGTISIESEEGKGTSITLKIPLVQKVKKMQLSAGDKA